MIQDISPHIYHNEYKNLSPKDQDFILIFQGNTVLVRFQDDKLRYPTFSEVRNFSLGYHYLFSIDEYRYFLAYSLSDDTNASPLCLPGYTYENVSLFRSAFSRHTAFAGITAHHLFDWYQSNQFCGRCGHSLIPDTRERMLYCPACHQMIYPRISPAVIVGVINQDKILLSRYAGRAYKKYALIAGFTEIGESAEQTVRREVMEEVGLKVKNIRYYKTQPWAFSDSLLIGYFAELDGSDKITLDTSELAEAGWFSRKEISLEDDHVSLTREMIRMFQEGKIFF